MVRITSPLSRILVATAALSLAGCAGGNSSADLSPAAPQQVEAQPQSSQSPAPSRPTPAGRNTQTAAPPPPPEPDVVLTPEKIKADCWMKFENDKKIKNVDARLALVEKCIDETSRRQPPQR